MTATLALMNIGNHPDDEVTFVSGSDELTLRRGEHTAYGVRVDDGFSFNVRQVRHADGSECRETIPMLLTKEGPGGDLVRADFNPSENDRVARLKQIAGALINECDVVREENPNAARHVSLAITAVEEAAMWAVKAATTELKGTDKRQVTNTKKLGDMFTWLITSRFGRAAALTAGVVLAFFAVRRSGYRAAQEDRAIQDANAALDVRGRADEAMRRAEGDNRPLDDRLAEHGRLRDD